MKKTIEDTIKFYKKMGEEKLQACLQTMEDAVNEARRDLEHAPDRALAWKIQRVVHTFAWGNANAQQSLCAALSCLYDIDKMMEKHD